MNNNGRITYLIGFVTALYWFYALHTGKELTSEFVNTSLLFMAFAFLLAIVNTFSKRPHER